MTIRELCWTHTALTDDQVDLLERAAAAMQYTADLTGADIFIDCLDREGKTFPGQLPELFFPGDGAADILFPNHHPNDPAPGIPDGGGFLADGLALVVNELLTNALEHGFQGRQRGTVTVTLLRGRETSTITVEDNGQGFSPGETREESLVAGLDVQNACHQLEVVLHPVVDLLHSHGMAVPGSCQSLPSMIY